MLGPDPNDKDNPGKSKDTPPDAPEWIQGLPEELRTAPEGEQPSLAKFKPGEGEELIPMPASVAKGYVELEKKLGQDSVVIPGENATEEERNAFYTRLGRPEKPDGYELKDPEGLPVDAEVKKSFQEIAHKAGINTQQAVMLNDWANDLAKKVMDGIPEILRIDPEKSKTALIKEYGGEIVRGGRTRQPSRGRQGLGQGGRGHERKPAQGNGTRGDGWGRAHPRTAHPDEEGSEVLASRQAGPGIRQTGPGRLCETFPRPGSHCSDR